MHNNIMIASSKERPPMLTQGSYAQWKSRFMRYVDTKPNRELLKKTIYEGPHIMTEITHQETLEDGHRPRHRESISIQDVKTKMFWEFGKFTSRDGELIKSYYTWLYILMNAMVRNKLKVDNMQVNVQFLRELQPEWSRFITIVKQANNLNNVSYHTLFDILKKHQNEVNEIRAERVARNSTPLALVTATQNYPDDYYQAPPAPKHYKCNASSSRQTTLTRSNATTMNKGKEIVKKPTPQSELASKKDSYKEQAQRDK
nr:hypothetical protein [Tanacetum cinerariifolium]